MYNSANVAERIKVLAKSEGISVKKLLEDVGLGINTMANMKTSMPKSDNLARIADYLGCSVDYLLGREDAPTMSVHHAQDSVILQGDNKHNTIVKNGSIASTPTLTEQELEVIRIFRNLDIRKQVTVLSQLYELEDEATET